MDTFTSDAMALSTLLDRAHGGALQLPDFRHGVLEGVTGGEVEPEFLLLDGQHRTMSLYLALRSGQAVRHGWELAEPDLGHHPTKISTRRTFSLSACFELLDLPLNENRRRAGYTP